jgi:hypothetical protein
MVSWYYYPLTENLIADRHLEILRQYHESAYIKSTTITEEQAEAIKQRYGFNIVLRERLRINICSVDFIEWLLALGFSTSKQGKVVPGFVHTLPDAHKASFLRGIYSADGNCGGGRNPVLTISDNRLREQVKLLLLSLGIRTNLSEGKTKQGIKNCKRWRRKASSILRIRDKDRFFALVGFIQPHKQPKSLTRPNESSKRMLVSRSVVEKYLGLVIAKNKKDGILSKRDLDDVRSILSGKDGCSFPRLLRLMSKADVSPPDWLTTYHFERVVVVEETGEMVDMFDVELHDERHQIATSGVMTHNSFRTPAFNVPEGLEYISLHSTNRDMEFSEWMNFNIKILSALCGADPAELNFLFGNVGQSNSLSQPPAEQRMKTSRDRGLRPILRAVAGWLNKHIIWPINDNYVIQFTGLDIKNASEIIDNKKKVVTFLKTVDELRAEEDLEPLPDGKGEVILDPTWLQHSSMIDQAAQMAQQQQQQGQEQEQEQEQGGEEENPEGEEEEEGGGEEPEGDEEEQQQPQQQQQQTAEPTRPPKKKSPWTEALGKSRTETPKKVAKIIRYEVELEK